MRRLRRIPLRVVVPVVLMAVLAILAALQYRWLGQVSQAERQRMHETMTERARLLAGDIDRELTRLYLAFQLREPDASRIEGGIAERYKVWRETARHPDLISGIYAVSEEGSLRRFDPETSTLAAVDWPEKLKAIRDRTATSRIQTTGRGGTVTFRLPPMISTDPLAISVLVQFIRHEVENGIHEARLMAAPVSLLIVLNEQKFIGEILPQLVSQHLGSALDEYRLSIVRTRTPNQVVYATTTDWVLFNPEKADVRVDALSLRPAINERMATELRAAQAVQPSAAQAGNRVTMVATQIPRAAMAGGTGAWQILLLHRAGSLEAAVTRVRRRNLLMSFGMLTLLAASVGLVLVSARRAERLASQQMDFVATVSHELRTPLAVIRSAGQNLAAGVVQDPKRYGELIETEGRRLTDMVEQTLALAGLSGERKPAAQQAIDPGDLVRAVLASPETATRVGDIRLETRIADELPLVMADEMLLRRGVQNLIANALKYGAGGGWVGVTVDAAGSRRGREVRITVSDRGPGVAPEDLPHIFDPFYRGRKAVADQVQGNGLGLHLVKRIAEAHGGRVTVRTAAGDGAAFTIHLPARADLAVPSLTGEQPGDARERSGASGPRERLS